MKTCSKCKVEKELSEFYKDHTRRDGLTYVCKTCISTYSSKYYKDNRERVLISTRRWQADNQDKVAVTGRRWRLDNKSKTIGYARKRRIKDKSKITSRRKLRTEIEAGRIPHVSTQVCADCGGQAENYHHPDYSEPLNAIPLCLACHIDRHRKHPPLTTGETQCHQQL